MFLVNESHSSQIQHCYCTHIPVAAKGIRPHHCLITKHFPSTSIILKVLQFKHVEFKNICNLFYVSCFWKMNDSERKRSTVTLKIEEKRQLYWTDIEYVCRIPVYATIRNLTEIHTVILLNIHFNGGPMCSESVTNIWSVLSGNTKPDNDFTSGPTLLCGSLWSAVRWAF